ncbi:MAG: Na+/H+ antiporter NhaC, partial [Desulfobacterales bacterium]|nr:Na+/H+ antiporter NhaC [Desulfobacterales bacterium]
PKEVSPSLGLSITVFVICAFSIGFSVLHYHVDAHIPMLFSGVVCATAGLFILKMPWKDIEQGIINGIKTALLPIIILMTVGLLVASWIAAGTVPTLIYYGLHILSPKFFLLASVVLCAIVSLATGSSWTTAGTVGLALMGIGGAMGIPLPMIAGAVVSGAYFGDKMSPLSDTTNLAPAVAGGELFDHIRAMMWTTVPTFCIAAVIYTVMGLKFGGDLATSESINQILSTLTNTYSIGLIPMIPPAFVLLASIKRMPALPALIVGIALACIIAVLVQGVVFKDLISMIHYGYESNTGIKVVDKLLSRGGLDHMMWTISLILCALSFGGIMEKCGFLSSILKGLGKVIAKPSSLVGTTIVSGVMSNIFLGDQFLGIILSGRTLKPAYDKMGLAPRMLSRTLEDSATLSSALIPWTACGAYMYGVLGVETFSYAPYALVNWMCPIVSYLMTVLGIGIFWKKTTEDAPVDAKMEAAGN